MSTPITFHEGEIALQEDNLYYQKIHQPQKLNLSEDMKWENLYFDELEDYTRELWSLILFCAVMILGRMVI
jgi:hypothetical protein